jgi:diaminopimelate epimerase
MQNLPQQQTVVVVGENAHTTAPRVYSLQLYDYGETLIQVSASCKSNTHMYVRIYNTRLSCGKQRAAVSRKYSYIYIGVPHAVSVCNLYLCWRERLGEIKTRLRHIQSFGYIIMVVFVHPDCIKIITLYTATHSFASGGWWLLGEKYIMSCVSEEQEGVCISVSLYVCI